MPGTEEDDCLTLGQAVGSPDAGDFTTPPGARQRLSVIVPLASEETEVEALLTQLRDLEADSEVLLVGGDVNARALADWPTRSSCRTLNCSAGRASAMNQAAGQARGAWLWFLHADTRLDPDVLPAMKRFLDHGEPALGWFDLRFRRDGPRLTVLNGWGANARSSLLGMPFGDQGLVLPAATFALVGGYDETAAFGEDHLLVWAVRRRGLPLCRIGATLSTSARKYARHGWWTTTRRHVSATATQAYEAWRCGRARPRDGAERD